MRKIIFSLFWILLGWIPLFSQDTLIIDLDMAINYALEHNPAIRNAQLEIEGEENKKRSAVDIPNPSIEYNHGQINSDLQDYQWFINQEMSFPTVYSSAKKKQEQMVGLSERYYSMSVNDLIRDVKHAYLLWIIQQQKEMIYLMVDTITSRFNQITKLQFEQGEISKLSMLYAETKYMRVKNILSEIRSDIRIAGNELKILLNTDMHLVTNQKDLVKLDIKFDGDSAWIMANPALRALNQEIAVMDADVKHEKMKLYPDLKLGYFNQSIDNNRGFQGWQIGIKVPLWYWSYDGRIQSSQIQKEMAENKFEYEQHIIRFRMEQMGEYYTKYKRSLEFYENTALVQSDLLLSVADKSYRSGEIDYIEFVQNASDAIDIKMNYLDALNNYNQTIIEMEYLLGIR